MGKRFLYYLRGHNKPIAITDISEDRDIEELSENITNMLCGSEICEFSTHFDGIIARPNDIIAVYISDIERDPSKIKVKPEKKVDEIDEKIDIDLLDLTDETEEDVDEFTFSDEEAEIINSSTETKIDNEMLSDAILKIASGDTVEAKKVVLSPSKQQYPGEVAVRKSNNDVYSNNSKQEVKNNNKTQNDNGVIIEYENPVGNGTVVSVRPVVMDARKGNP